MKQNEDINWALNGSKERRTDGSRDLSIVGMYPRSQQNRLINDHDLGLAGSAHAHCRSCLEWPMTARSVCTGSYVDACWQSVDDSDCHP